MALTKVKGSGVEGITNLSNATFLSVNASEVATLLTSAVINSEGGAVTTNIAQGLCKVWADVDMTGTATLDDSFNASGLTDHGTGSFTITHNSDMGNGNYVYTAGFNNEVSDASAYIKIHSPSDKLAASAKFLKKENGSAADCTGNYIAIHGDLA